MDYLSTLLPCFRGNEVFGDTPFPYANVQDYLFEQSLIAKKERAIPYNVFFERCLDLIQQFENDLKESYYKELSRWNKLAVINKGLIEEDEKEIEELRKEGKNRFSVHLYSFTNGRFQGHLWGDRIQVVKDEVLKVQQYYRAKKEVKNFKRGLSSVSSLRELIDKHTIVFPMIKENPIAETGDLLAKYQKAFNTKERELKKYLDKSDSLRNFRQVKEKIEAFLINVEYDFLDEKLIDRQVKYLNEPIDSTILLYRAQKEITRLASKEGTLELLDEVNSSTRWMFGEFDRLVKKHKINFGKGYDYSVTEFFDVRQPFFEFYDWFYSSYGFNYLTEKEKQEKKIQLEEYKERNKGEKLSEVVYAYETKLNTLKETNKDGESTSFKYDSFKSLFHSDRVEVNKESEEKFKELFERRKPKEVASILLALEITGRMKSENLKERVNVLNKFLQTKYKDDSIGSAQRYLRKICSNSVDEIKEELSEKIDLIEDILPLKVR